MSSTRKRGARVLGSATALLIVVGLAACDYGPDGDPENLTVAGSDTTQDVMEAIANDYNASTYNDDENIPGDEADTLYNINSVQNPVESVPGDEHCGTRNWHTPPGAGEVASPNGSTEGRDALKTSVLAGDGCVDIARSSSGPRTVGTGAGQDPSSFQYYAFALDAVGWSSASSLAPANLTQAQLQGIYNCTFTNWNQVGGGNGQIERYWPQAGSGTRAFAQSDLLGFDPTTFSSASCPAVTLTQENSGTTIAANGDQQVAVVPYSGANWVAAARGTQPDQRAGQTIRDLNGQAIIAGSGASSTLNTAGPVNEDNVRLNDSTPAYPGIRYVFNVIDTTQPSYQSTLRYTGFDNVVDGSTAPLCSGGKAEIITNFGFGPLAAGGPYVVNQSSTCRGYSL